MTNPDYTHLTLVVDRSGSMSSVQVEAQNGINVLLQEQLAEPGKFTVTLTQFDTEIDTVFRVAALPSDYTLEPRGMTALLDAVGAEIIRTGQDLAAMPEAERPGKVLFVVVTDGAENSSHEYNLARVRSLIAEQRDVYGWEFQFIGADDAAWQGEEMGMRSSRSRQTGDGQRALYRKLNESVKDFRKSDPGMEFIMDQDLGEEDEEGNPKI